MPYPLRFRPYNKSVMWGGRRIERLGRALPEGPIGESWELADFDDPATGRSWSSVIDNGPLAGTTLSRALADFPDELAGTVRPADGRFPLLVKYIDASLALSVQVHPDAASAQRIGGKARSKSECWYVLAADPDAVLHRGLVPGTDAVALERALATGRMQDVLLSEPAEPGALYFVPSGTVHAIGAGVMLAEFQEPSDTVYRLWDWNRPDPATGKPRELHVAAALEAIDFSARPVEPTRFAGRFDEPYTLVKCPQFEVREIRTSGWYVPPKAPDGARVWMCLSGEGRLETEDGQSIVIRGGDTLLLPACIGVFQLRSQSSVRLLEALPPTYA